MNPWISSNSSYPIENQTVLTEDSIGLSVLHSDVSFVQQLRLGSSVYPEVTNPRRPTLNVSAQATGYGTRGVGTGN